MEKNEICSQCEASGVTVPEAVVSVDALKHSRVFEPQPAEFVFPREGCIPLTQKKI